MMNELLKTILSLSLSGTPAILLLLLTRPLWEKRFGKGWQYYIWLVVIFRLLLPWAPGPNPVGNLFLHSQQRETAYTTPYAIADTEAEAPSASVPDTIPVPPQSQLPVSAVPARPVSDGLPTLLHSIGRNLWLLWLATAVILFVRKVMVYRNFVSAVKAGSMPVSEPGRLEHFGRLAAQTRVRGSLELCVNPRLSSPLLTGFFRPCIVLTDADLPETDFHYTVLHELTHCRRLDMFYKWLVQLTVCLHWFNPFVRQMAKEINRACELSCDAAVLRGLDGSQKRAYGDTLLNAVKPKGVHTVPLTSVSLNESKELMKERLEAIMKHKKLSKPVKVLTFLFTVLLAGSAFALGAYAAPAPGKTSGATSLPADSTQSPAAAAPSADNVSRPAASERITEIFWKNGQYLILCDGASKEDCPDGCVTDDYFALCLVFPDRYSVIGPFPDRKAKHLTQTVSDCCNELLEQGTLTTDDRDLFTAAAAKLENPEPETVTVSTGAKRSPASYTYTQEGFYEPPYLFTIGWNLHESAPDSYANAETVILDDGAALTVFFEPSCQNIMQNTEASKALTTLLSSLKKETAGTPLPLELPLVSAAQYIGNRDVRDLAAEYYKEGNSIGFTAVLPKLDAETQYQYLADAYEDKNTALFAASLNKLAAKTINNETFGTEIFKTEIIDTYAEKAYQDNSTSFFSVLTRYMDKETLQYWLTRSEKDQKTNFTVICRQAATN